MRKLHYIFLATIICLAFFLRLYKVTEYPVQLNHDEVSQLYDAMSILKTGKDIYGNKLPFIFVSINDFKPPFYTYATIPFVYLLGNGELSIKLVGVLFGTLIVAGVYFFSSQVFANKYVSLIAAFFTAIAPFEIHYSRKGFEGGVGVFILLVGFGFLFSYLRNRNKKKHFIVGSLILALSMYVYFSYTILVPILYLLFLGILIWGRVNFPKTGFLVFAALITPLMIMIIKDENSKNRTENVALSQDSKLVTIINKNLDKSDKLHVAKKNVIVLRYAVAKYMDQFNPTFMFVNGLDMSNQDPFDIGPFYLFQLPLMIIGFVVLIKHDYKKNKLLFTFLMLLILIGVLPSALSFESHSPHRILIVLSLLNIISAYGAYLFFRYIFSKTKSPLTRIVFCCLCAFIVCFSFAYFAFLYRVDYPIDKSEYIQYPYKEVSLLIKNYYQDYDKVIFDPRFGKDSPWIGGAAYYYLAYYGDFPVEKIQKEYTVTNEGKSKVSFGKYEIRSVYWPEDKNLKNTLIIASPWVISRETFGSAVLLDEIKNYQKTQTAFYVLSLK